MAIASVSTIESSRADLHGGPAVKFCDVSVGFDEGEVLRGISFTVAERETLVLLGETGTGKTLTLKLAAGLLRPSAGKVEVLGQDVSGMTERELLEFRRKIGFVFQEGALFDSMTVEENVAYRLREEHVPEAEIAPRVDCTGAGEPARDCVVRFANRGSGSGNFADDHYIDFAAARFLWSDVAAGDAPLAGWICAGEFPV
jgi:ABC-type transport system involved in cytochrome bd biosynthesis fused ATPase/permease subunit